MEAITITFPAIDTQVIAELNETEQILATEELAFIRALRAKYGDLAKLNGNIRISRYSISDSNWSQSGDTYLVTTDGKTVKGLLALDGFEEPNTSQFSGSSTGYRLFMVGGRNHKDGWVEIKRTGAWSQYQGSADYWTCSGTFADGREFEASENYGIRWMTDEQVAAEYNVKDIAEQMAKTLSELATKIPERLNRKRQLAASLKDAVQNIVGASR